MNLKMIILSILLATSIVNALSKGVQDEAMEEDEFNPAAMTIVPGFVSCQNNLLYCFKWDSILTSNRCACAYSNPEYCLCMQANGNLAIYQLKYGFTISPYRIITDAC